MDTDADEALRVSVVGDWDIEVGCGRIDVGEETVRIETPVRLTVSPLEPIVVERERYDPLPIFDRKAPGWTRGVRLVGCRSQETTVKDGLHPVSLVVYCAAEGAACYEAGRDYGTDLEWATLGRLPGGRIQDGQAVFVSYRYGLSRIDSVVVEQSGAIFLRTGTPHVCAPRPPDVGPRERTLANIWIPGRLSRLTGEHLFPIQRDALEEPGSASWACAEACLPRTLRKLRDGESVRILAWGDSVTDAGYLEVKEDRWQAQFVARLRQRFPEAEIDLQTVGWGGRRSRSFVDEPDDSPYSYRTKVLGSGADLIVSEFVNDSALNADQVDELYGRFLANFRAAGAEWIILAPHYVRPDWMGLTSQKDVDEDPRPFVQALRAFAEREGVALADASARWGRLWRQGIPYTTLLLNAINHPDERGMKMFADSLMALFPEDGISPNR